MNSKLTDDDVTDDDLEKCEDLIEITAHPTGRLTYVKFSLVIGAGGNVFYRAIYKEEREDGRCYDYTASVQLPEKRNPE